ncbi:TPA: hypothetical protein DCF80_03825 [Candidatus Saccharibacteria bacterium]|nr:hypothetical protein [Candidatus Saccharibacteria bacterium]
METDTDRLRFVLRLVDHVGRLVKQGTMDAFIPRDTVDPRDFDKSTGWSERDYCDIAEDATGKLQLFGDEVMVTYDGHPGSLGFVLAPAAPDFLPAL